jgi:hypothetical protein
MHEMSEIGEIYQPNANLAAWHQSGLKGFAALQAVGRTVRER